MNFSISRLSIGTVLNLSPFILYPHVSRPNTVTINNGQFSRYGAPILVSSSTCVSAKVSNTIFKFVLDTPVVLALTLVSNINYSSNPLSITDQTVVSFTNCIFSDALSTNAAGGLYVSNSNCNFSAVSCNFIRCVTTTTDGWTAGGLAVRASNISTAQRLTFYQCSVSSQIYSYVFSSGIEDCISVDVNYTIDYQCGTYNGYTASIGPHSGAKNRLCLSHNNHSSNAASTRTAGFCIATAPRGATTVQFDIVSNCSGKSFLLVIFCNSTFAINRSIFCNNTISSSGGMVECLSSYTNFGFVECAFIGASSSPVFWYSASGVIVATFIRCCFDTAFSYSSESQNYFFETVTGQCVANSGTNVFSPIFKAYDAYQKIFPAAISVILCASC